jgi:hypothetical protein
VSCPPSVAFAPWGANQADGKLRPVLNAAISSGLIALLVGACDWPVSDDLQTAVVTNQTDSVVIVYLDYPDRETDIMRLRPGESETENFSHPSDSCAPATMIARTISGDEVARREQPFCVGDTWAIQAADSN